MADWVVPLADVVVPPSDREAVVATYESGWLSMGPRTAELEAEFARYTGAGHAVAVSSGTAALHLACLTAGIGPGDEVVVPSMTFVATANAVAYTGAQPVFADIAGLTEPWLSTQGCESAVSPRTKAIMTTDYGGHPGEIKALRELAERRGLVLLEDAAHAAGSRVDGRHLGTFGAAGAFSFFSNKNLAIGEGGMLVTDDEGVAESARTLRSHGMTTLTWDRHRGHASEYDVIALGFNYRLDEPRAALAGHRLRRLDEENAIRARLDSRYREALSGAGVVCALPPLPEADLAHHLFTIVLDEGADRGRFRSELAERGIQTSVHYPPVHRFAIYRREGAAELPLTDAYAARTVTLPMFAHMSEEQQDLVIAAVGAALDGGG